MKPIHFIVDTLLWPVAVGGDGAPAAAVDAGGFPQPACQAVVRLTNPLILPLRRMLPPHRQDRHRLGRGGAAVAAVKSCRALLLDVRPVPQPELLLRELVLEIARTLLWTYSIRDRAVCAAVADAPGRLLARAVAAARRCASRCCAHPAADPAAAASTCRPCGRARIQALLILLR